MAVFDAGDPLVPALGDADGARESGLGGTPGGQQALEKLNHLQGLGPRFPNRFGKGLADRESSRDQVIADTDLSAEQLKELLAESLAKLGVQSRVLIVPPDQSRAHSRARRKRTRAPG